MDLVLKVEGSDEVVLGVSQFEAHDVTVAWDGKTERKTTTVRATFVDPARASKALSGMTGVRQNVEIALTDAGENDLVIPRAAVAQVFVDAARDLLVVFGAPSN